MSEERDEIKVRVDFDFEVIDFYDFTKKDGRFFDKVMTDFRLSLYYNEDDFDFDYWDWFAFFEKYLPTDFDTIWILFVESTYPYSHSLAVEEDSE